VAGRGVGMNRNAESVQVAVVGAGPGGYAAAFLAADLGLQVALVDPEPNPGGICLYRGCIPSKALLHVAKVLAEARQAASWGIEFGAPAIQLEKLRDWKAGVVRKLTTGLGLLSRQRNVRYIQGWAGLGDAHTLHIQGNNGQQRLRCDHIILATGSRPVPWPDPGAVGLESPRVWDSNRALELPEIPRTLLVIGGGYIGLELGSVYAALGAQVTVVEMMPSLLPGVDADLVGVLHRRLEKVFASIRLNTKVARMNDAAGRIEVEFEGQGQSAQPETFDAVLVSVGRKPNSAIAGIEKARVELDARGFVQVDAQRRTSASNIFAIGDLAGEPMLAHKASHEGRVAVEAIVGHKVAFEPQAIPAVVFTDPEVAWCGLTETQAQKENRPVRVARFPWAASGRAMTLDHTEGITKLILDAESDRVLGVGIVGAGAGELIAEGVLAVEMAATATDLRLSIHPHPTLSETLMEAAEVFFGQATHIYRPKKS